MHSTRFGRKFNGWRSGRCVNSACVMFSTDLVQGQAHFRPEHTPPALNTENRRLDTNFASKPLCPPYSSRIDRTVFSYGVRTTRLWYRRFLRHCHKKNRSETVKFRCGLEFQPAFKLHGRQLARTKILRRCRRYQSRWHYQETNRDELPVVRLHSPSA